MLELRQPDMPVTWPPADRELTIRIWRIYTIAWSRGWTPGLRTVAKHAGCSLTMAARARHALKAYGHLVTPRRAPRRTAVRVGVWRGPLRTRMMPRAELPEHVHILLAKLGR